MAIELSNVWKVYGSTVALRDVSLAIDEGSRVLILGPNGSGKSTLLSIIVGADKPSKGRVRVFGFDPWRDHGKVVDRVSALLDRTNVYPWMSGIELVRTVARARGIPWSRALEIAETLGVTSYWHRSFYSYSTGMKRRLLLLLALISDSDLLVLDEPFQGIDDESRRKVIEILKKSSSSTILVATHIVPIEILDTVTHVMKLELGRVVLYGAIDRYRVELGNISIDLRCIERS